MVLGVILLVTLGVSFVVGFTLGIDYEFRRISSDPAVKVAIEMGRRMKRD